MDRDNRQDTNVTVTSEQIGRLERALLATRDSSGGTPEVLETIAAIQYQEIVRLRTELDAALGFAEETCDLMISLGGPNIGVGVAPASAIATALNNMHGAIQTILAYLTTGQLPGRGRLPDRVSRPADFRFVGVAKGSVRIRLNLPEATTLFPEYESEPIERSVRLILEAVGWVSSLSGVDELERRIADQRLTRLLLSQVRRVAPSPSGAVQRVEFSGRLVDAESRYILSRSSIRRIREAFDTAPLVSTRVAEEGKLRSVDVDSGIFQLRQRPDDQPDIRCIIPREIIGEAISYLVDDAVVIVEGVLSLDERERPTNLNVEEIYPTGEDSR